MNRRDLVIVIFLFALWLLWSPIDRNIIKPLFFPDREVPEEVMEEPVREPPARVEVDEVREPEDPREPFVDPVVEPPEIERPEEALPDVPEQTAVLRSDRAEVVVSSHGATVRSVILKRYRETREPDSGPVVLLYDEQPALEIDLDELDARTPYDMTVIEEARAVRFTRTTTYGVEWVREIRLPAEGYRVEVVDQIRNAAAAPVRVRRHEVITGDIRPLVDATSMYGLSPVGVDILPAGDRVRHLSREIPRRLGRTTASILRDVEEEPVDWVASKNKYFAQILRPHDGAEAYTVYVERVGQTDDPARIWTGLHFPELRLDTGEVFERRMDYYTGPKRFNELAKLGYHQTDVMELGWLRPISVLLLHALNFVAEHVPPYNYGFAIMLLTLIIRIVFWPLTHKGTESMRRMQELSPLMKEISEKYQDDPRKKQEAMMSLYKEHKINPLGGCMPMLVQIPVFIGLFYVLRSAIELRFARFLWIRDLSEPESLIEFGFTIPLLGWDSLNILPIFMAVTMFLQQKLTPMPSQGDPRQQQVQRSMMKFMPVMMLFILYNFASGLALYWSTQNVLMIVQQLIYRKRLAARKEAEGQSQAAAPGGSVSAPVKEAPHGKPGKRKKKKR